MTDQSRFHRCLHEFTWRPENDGQPFHTDPGDKGGPTSWGVTLTTYATWRALHRLPAPLANDLAEATQAELEAVYFDLFWTTVQADQLPVGLDLMVFDQAVLSGPRRAVVQLQTRLGVKTDGRLGPITLEAAHAGSGLDLLFRLEREQSAELPHSVTFVGGWKRRVFDRLWMSVLDMSGYWKAAA